MLQGTKKRFVRLQKLERRCQVSAIRITQALRCSLNIFKAYCRDLAPILNFENDIKTNDERRKNLRKFFEEDVKALYDKSLLLKQEFYQKYEDMHVNIERLCLEGDLIKASEQLAFLKKYFDDYKILYNKMLKEKESLQFRSEAIKDLLDKSKREGSAPSYSGHSKVQDEREEALFLKEQAERKQQEEKEAKEDLERRARYQKQREEFKKERDRKLRLEQEAEKKRLKVDETVRNMMALDANIEASQQDLLEDQISLIRKLDASMKGIDAENGKLDISYASKVASKTPAESKTSKDALVIFSKSASQKFTFEAASDLANTLKQRDLKQKLKFEINLLEQCIEASLELQPEIEALLAKEGKEKKEILKTLKIQRSALLGSIAQCMENFKQLKGNAIFTESHARKLRNYLFKGKRFVIDEKTNPKDCHQFNLELINMSMEFISATRAQFKGEHDPAKPIASKLLQEIAKESEELDSEEIPSISVCKRTIALAEKEIEYYERNDTLNPTLILSASTYVKALLGTFSIWIRDYHWKEYLQDQFKYDSYIETGNTIRHGGKKLI